MTNGPMGCREAVAVARTLGFTAVLVLLFGLIGWAVGSYFLDDWILGSLSFLGFAALLNVAAFLFSDRIVLWSYRARILREEEYPCLFRTVRDLTGLYGLPMPKVALISSATPNAMATGRGPKRAVVAVTTGLLDILDEDELRGVLAHELGHVQNRDIFVMTVAATIAGAIAFLSRIFLWGSLWGGSRRERSGLEGVLVLIAAIAVPVAALLIQLAVSRDREYGADRTGALTARNPAALISALKKLERANRARPFRSGNPASAGLFIVNPFRGAAILSLFSTHPPMNRRIARLSVLQVGRD